MGIIKDDFESIPDHRVGVGEITVKADPKGYEGEAEWVVRFPRPIVTYASYTAEQLKEVRLTVFGLIEGKALAGLGDVNEISWAKACVGNNVLTEGNGYEETLGKLRNPEIAAKLCLREEFHGPKGESLKLPSGRMISREACLGDTDAQYVLEPVTLLKWIQRLDEGTAGMSKTRKIRHLNLSALGDYCAAVNFSQYKRPATFSALLKTGVRPWKWSRDQLGDQGRADTVANVLKGKDALGPSGGTIELSFRYPNGRDFAKLKVKP